MLPCESQKREKEDPSGRGRFWLDAILVYPSTWTLQDATMFVHGIIRGNSDFADASTGFYMKSTTSSLEADVILPRRVLSAGEKAALIASLRAFEPRLVDGAFLKFYVRVDHGIDMDALADG